MAPIRLPRPGTGALFAGVLSAGIGLAAAAGAGTSRAIDTTAAPDVIEIKNMRFQPQTLTVPAGTTVEWKNEDNNPHTVTDKDRGFRSAALDTGDTFSFTFKSPGEFTYICTIHPFMVGRIVVTAGGKPS